MGTVCLGALAVLPIAPFDLTCFLMSNFWVAHENYCSSETTSGISNEWKVKVLGKDLSSRGWGRRGEGKTDSFRQSDDW